MLIVNQPGWDLDVMPSNSIWHSVARVINSEKYLFKYEGLYGDENHLLQSG